MPDSRLYINDLYLIYFIERKWCAMFIDEFDDADKLKDEYYTH